MSYLQNAMETYEIPGLGELSLNSKTRDGSARYFASINGAQISPERDSYSDMRTEALHYSLLVLKTNDKKAKTMLLKSSRLDHRLMREIESYNAGVMDITDLIQQINNGEAS